MIHRCAMNVCLKARDPLADRKTLILLLVQFFKLNHYQRALFIDHHRPDLDGAGRRRGYARGDGHRFVEVFGFHQEVAA